MCGIVYRKSFLNENVSQSILQMYKNQRSRGTQGFGFYIPKTDKIKHETIEKNMVKDYIFILKNGWKHPV